MQGVDKDFTTLGNEFSTDETPQEIPTFCGCGSKSCRCEPQDDLGLVYDPQVDENRSETYYPGQLKFHPFKIDKGMSDLQTLAILNSLDLVHRQLAELASAIHELADNLG